MVRVVIAGVLGAIVLFIWGFLAWMVLGLHDNSVRELANESQVTSMLKNQIDQTGAYFFPGMGDMEAPDMTDDERQALQDQWVERHAEGPVGILFITPDGLDPMTPATFICGFGINLITALLAALMLYTAAGSLSGFVGRVLYVIGFGLLIVLYAHVTNWNWLHFPADYTAMMIVDNIIAWLLLGLVLAAIIKPKQQPVAATTTHHAAP